MFACLFVSKAKLRTVCRPILDTKKREKTEGKEVSLKITLSVSISLGPLVIRAEKYKDTTKQQTSNLCVALTK